MDPPAAWAAFSWEGQLGLKMHPWGFVSKSSAVIRRGPRGQSGGLASSGGWRRLAWGRRWGPRGAWVAASEGTEAAEESPTSRAPQTPSRVCGKGCVPTCPRLAGVHTPLLDVDALPAAPLRPRLLCSPATTAAPRPTAQVCVPVKQLLTSEPGRSPLCRGRLTVCPIAVIV